MYPKNARTYVMTPTRRRICKPLVRKSRCSVARQCLKDTVIQKYVVKGIGLTLRKEIAKLCSDDVKSVLRDHSPDALKTFEWKKVIQEMGFRAPTLLTLLQWCTKTKKEKVNRECIIGFIAAVMCRYRRPCYSLIQRLLSIVLYAGHASKSVSTVYIYIPLGIQEKIIVFCTKTHASKY